MLKKIIGKIINFYKTLAYKRRLKKIRKQKDPYLYR